MSWPRTIELPRRRLPGSGPSRRRPCRERRLVHRRANGGRSGQARHSRPPSSGRMGGLAARLGGPCINPEYTYTATYITIAARELRCFGAEQDDLCLRRRPVPLSARPGARGRQPLGGDRDALKRYVDVEAGTRRRLRRGRGPRRTRLRPKGPLHRRPRGRVGRHHRQPHARSSASIAAGPGKYVLHIERSPSTGWSTLKASPPAGVATSASATSATAARRGVDPRGLRHPRAAPRQGPSRALRHGRTTARQPPVEELDI